MNNARIEQEADLALCQVAIQCPDAIVKTETSEEQLNQIRTGMGEDMTKLLHESKTQAICFTAEEGVKEAAPVTLSFGYQDTDRKGNRIDSCNGLLQQRGNWYCSNSDKDSRREECKVKADSD